MASSKNKLRRVRILMILCQAVLLCFMAYWLRSEYYGEQEVLKKDLTSQLEHCQGIVADSVISVTIINPIMNEMRKTAKPGKLMKFTDSIHDVRLIPNPNGLKYQKDTVSVFTTGSTYKLHRNKPDPDLTRGIKMIMKNMQAKVPVIGDGVNQIDTFLLGKVFNSSIKKTGYVFATRWMPSNISLPKHQLFLNSDLTPGYNLEIFSYKYHLLRKLWPQILITVFLLGLTAIAFWVTYKSLRAQTRLAAIRNEFISNMSHELKTPVSTVKVTLEALQEPGVLEDSKTSHEYIHIATLELNRLELLINQTLQSSLLEESRIQLQQETVDLLPLIQDLIRTLQPRLVLQNTRLELETTGPEFIIKADRLQVQGVIVNIFDNALKYAGPSPFIQIVLTKNETGISLSFSDNGPGIPAQYALRIFDKFFRVPHGNEHSIKGYGLGLSYASQVMKLHRGSIRMLPSESGGCQFILQFPHV